MRMMRAEFLLVLVRIARAARLEQSELIGFLEELTNVIRLEIEIRFDQGDFAGIVRE